MLRKNNWNRKYNNFDHEKTRNQNLEKQKHAQLEYLFNFGFSIIHHWSKFQIR